MCKWESWSACRCGKIPQIFSLEFSSHLRTLPWGPERNHITVHTPVTLTSVHAHTLKAHPPKRLWIIDVINNRYCIERSYYKLINFTRSIGTWYWGIPSIMHQTNDWLVLLNIWFYYIYYICLVLAMKKNHSWDLNCFPRWQWD